MQKYHIHHPWDWVVLLLLVCAFNQVEGKRAFIRSGHLHNLDVLSL